MVISPIHFWFARIQHVSRQERQENSFSVFGAPFAHLDRLSMLVIIVPVKVDKSGSAPRPAPPLLDTTDKKSSHLQIGPRTKPFQSTTRLEPVT
jgi:hypothetical protein